MPSTRRCAGSGLAGQCLAAVAALLPRSQPPLLIAALPTTAPCCLPRAPQVVHACALELDFQILAAGDQSKAGLRGINLSGGQRQRLNLARCAYFSACPGA